MLSFTLPLPLRRPLLRRLEPRSPGGAPGVRPHPAGALALFAVLALPAGSAIAQPDDTRSDTRSDTSAPDPAYTALPSVQPPAAERQPSFAAAFAPLAASAPAPAAATPPPGAVDLASFEPPLEQPEATRALGSGIASYYGQRFHGRRTANGERFDMNAMTAAHRTLPFGSLVRVTNPANGRSVTVRINDRGPFVRGRSIDLSREAARRIGLIARGHAPVELEVVER